jgi:hypothetical protein
MIRLIAKASQEGGAYLPRPASGSNGKADLRFYRFNSFNQIEPQIINFPHTVDDLLKGRKR